MLAYEDYDLVDLQTFKTKRRNKKQRKKQQSNGLMLKKIQPKTSNQEKAFDAYHSNKHCVLHGVAGTGKTYILTALALEEMLTSQNKEKIIFIRSVVPTRDIGFLPGNETEKGKMYEMPYANTVNDLFGRGDAYEILKNKKQIEFMTTSFLRGLTFDNAIVIVDEAQNMTFQELDTVITRIGENTRFCISGDFRQSDLSGNGLMSFIRLLNKTDEFSFIDFSVADIVRSGLVKKYLTAKALHS